MWCCLKEQFEVTFLPVSNLKMNDGKDRGRTRDSEVRIGPKGNSERDLFEHR